MNSLFTKLRDFVGLNETGYNYDYPEGAGENYQSFYPEEAGAPGEEDQRSRRRVRERVGFSTSSNANNEGMNNVIGMPGAAYGYSEVVVLEPHSFEEMPQVIQSLRERKSVVLNLTLMDPDQAQRAVDFVAGGTYAIDGHQERIGESIFLFTPSCVQVSTQAGNLHEIPRPQARVARPDFSSTAWTGNEPLRMVQ